MPYKLLYSAQAKKGIEDLPGDKMKRIAERVLLKIAENPFFGKRLSGRLTGLYSARITRRYRVIYRIDIDAQIVLVLDIAHRRESYR